MADTKDLACLLSSLESRDEGTRKVVPGETVPFDLEGNVFFRTPPYKGLRVEPAEELESVRYVSKRGRVPQGSRAIITLHHGTGAPYSHSGAMLSALNTLTAEKTAKASGFVADLQNDPDHVYLAAEAIDCPGHGAGPDLSKYGQIDRVLEWMGQEFSNLKEYQLPVIPLTRSGAAGPVISLNNQRPGLLNGMILMSPLHPKGIAHSMSFLTAAAEKPPSHPEFVVIRWAGINWINDLYEQIAQKALWQEQNPFGDTPVLILMGRKDPQISIGARAEFIHSLNLEISPERVKQLAEEDKEDVFLQSGSKWYLQLAEADHDVLQNRNRESSLVAKKAYHVIFQFVRHVETVCKLHSETQRN